MSDKGIKDYELIERSCDSLVLAYSPDHVLGSNYRSYFYIPSSENIQRAVGYSLRKILGGREAGGGWRDLVEWLTIANLEKLEPRILKGMKGAIDRYPDCKPPFEEYLSSLNFENHWVYLKGDMYKFKDGKREEALQKFNDYWNEKEKSRWEQIHNFMREYTQKKFEEKIRLIQE